MTQPLLAQRAAPLLPRQFVAAATALAAEPTARRGANTARRRGEQRRLRALGEDVGVVAEAVLAERRRAVAHVEAAVVLVDKRLVGDPEQRGVALDRHPQLPRRRQHERDRVLERVRAAVEHEGGAAVQRRRRRVVGRLVALVVVGTRWRGKTR